MLLFRWLLLLLLLGAGVSFAIYAATGQPQYKRFGLKALKLVLYVGLAFFGVLVLERLG